MGRTGLVGHESDDEISTDEQESAMDDVVTTFRPLRVSRFRTNQPSIAGGSSEAGPSRISSKQQQSQPFSSSHGVTGRLRRRVAENPSTSNSNSASNSPRQPSPKLPRLGVDNSRNLPRQRATTFLDRSSGGNAFRTQFRRPPRVFDSDDEDTSTAMNASIVVLSTDEDESLRERPVQRRVARLWTSSTGRNPNATTTSTERRNRQQQLQADEAYARRLQAQYDAQFQAELQQRRRNEALALRRRGRARNRASNRPLTPPIPRRFRNLSGSVDGDDEDDDFFVGLVLERSVMADSDLWESNARRRHGRATSPSGPTTLATVRRYFREAHMDADLFPGDNNISVLDFEALLELADRLGDGAPSMSTSEINRLPTCIFRQAIPLVDISDQAETSSSGSGSSNGTNFSDDSPTCAVCMEKFVDGDVQRNLPCFHLFHKDCVDVWLKQRSSCPVCRVDARRTSPAGSP